MKHFLHILAILSVISLGSPQIALAWSAWNWTSKTAPFDLLPWMIVLAIVIETSLLFGCTKIDFKKIACIVILTNCISLAAPYGLDGLAAMSAGDSFLGYIEKWKIYTINWEYGIVTAAVEIPILYRKFKESFEKRKLLEYIIAVNVLTTIMIFLVERMVCEGAWLSM